MHAFLSVTSVNIYLLLAINLNVHCSNSESINIVLHTLKGAYNVERRIFVVLSLRSYVLLLSSWTVNTVCYFALTVRIFDRFQRYIKELNGH